jgi:glycosyltransferase involved in cell wall biosynthesis
LSSRPIRRFLRGLLPAPLRETYHRFALDRDFGISSRTGERRRARLDSTLEPGLNLVGYFASPSGVGQSARALAQAAEAAGIPVARIDAGSLEDGPTIAAPYAVNLFHVNADGAAAAVELCGPRVHRGRANVGYWYWETERFPLRWRDRFHYFDEIWVASEFCRMALDPVSPIPVAVVPPPVVVGATARAPRERGATFRFVTVCDASSVPERKNPLGAVRAFARAFGDDPSVALTVRISNAEAAPGLLDALAAAGGPANVEIDAAPADRAGIEERLARCDAYVSLHRAEGFGLPIAEAMALGKPVVVTDYSGSRDFVDEETGFPVRWAPAVLTRAAGPYEEGTRWAEPDEEHAVETLRRVVRDRSEAVRRAEAGRRRIEARYGLEPAGRRLASRLETMRARLISRP